MYDTLKVRDKMSERGFSEVMRGYDGKGELITITYCTMRLDGTDISCVVNFQKDTFHFIWCVPKSINQLLTGELGSFFDDQHFDNLYGRILKQACILYRELMKEGDGVAGTQR